MLSNILDHPIAHLADRFGTSAQTSTYQAASILSIQPKDTSSRVHKITDAPPPSSEADYDVKVKIGDRDYVGRYRLKDLAGKEVAMPIVQREPATAPSM